MVKKLTNGACLMACLFFSQFSIAKIVKDEKSVTNRSIHSYKEVCKFLTKRESPLVEFKSISKLNCMGDIKEVAPYCDFKEAANPYYIRAIVNQKRSQVECLSAKKVILKYECGDKNDRYCIDSEMGCFMLGEKLAKRLRIVHDSKTDSDKFLNCYFEPKKSSFKLIP